MMIDSNIPSIWKLVIAILFCEVVGISSGLLSMAEMNPWFSTLSKPSWNPPSYLFGPVWSVLYLLIGSMANLEQHSHTSKGKCNILIFSAIVF